MSIETAKKRIQEAKEQKLTSLDLSNCGLSNLEKEIPELFEDMEHLEELNLILNIKIQDISVLEKLPNLTTLDFSITQVQDISVLAKLTNLTELHFMGTQVQDISVLAKLTNLTKLDFRGTQIQNISILEKLPNLTTLYFGETQVQDISVLEKLINLTTLDFYYTKVRDISALGNLTNLIELHFGGTQVQDINVLGKLSNLIKLAFMRTQVQDISSLGNLTNLKILNFWETQVQDISVLEKLTNLIKLTFSNTQVQDISVLEKLTNLIELHFSNTQVQDISVLGNLTNLEELYIYNNSIRKLPRFFKNFEKIEYAGFEGNLFMRYVPNLSKLNTKEQINYILDLQERSRPVREAKVVFVGQGDIGKTTLLGWLLEGKKPETKQTDKIEIRDNEVLFTYKNQENGKEEALNVHFWDFGGQEIMHATHKFFMTERTVYVLVTNNRSEDNEKLEQWMDLLKSTCGDSPVIIAANRCDKPEYAHSLNEKELKYQFDNIQLPIIATSGDTGRGIKDLQNAIQQALSKLDYLEFPVPAPFFSAKEQLQALKKAYIDYDKFEEICQEIATKEDYDFGEGKQEIFADLLNDLGILLNFRKKKEENLHDLMVFSPEWIINGVFAIIVNGNSEKGILNEAQIRDILKSKGIKKSKEWDYIVRMMQSFKLSYENSFCGKKTHFIPSIFDKNKPYEKLAEVWGKPEKSLRFRFKYGVWRDDFINYIIVKEHENIKQNPHWRNGVVLEYTYDNRVNKIKVESFRREKYIDLEITGEADFRYTLEHFRKGVMPYIHEMFTKIEPSEWVVYEENGIMVELDYEELAFSIEDGEDWKYIKEFRKKVNIKNLLGYVDLPKEEATKRLIDRLLQEGNEEKIVALLRKGELSKEMVINIISVSGDNNVIGQYLKESGFMIGERGEKAFHLPKTKHSNFKEMVTKGNISQAITDILTLAQGTDLHNDLALLSQRHNFNESENNKGVLASDIYKLERNKISAALLGYIDQLSEA